jgi:hypothetical protein
MERLMQWAAAKNAGNIGLGDMMAAASQAMAFQNEILQIEGRALSFRDRYYLKQRIQLWLNKPI